VQTGLPEEALIGKFQGSAEYFAGPKDWNSGAPLGTIANQVSISANGSRHDGSSRGMDFDVNQDIVITRLGVFTLSLEGFLFGPLTATIYSRDPDPGTTTHTPLARITFPRSGAPAPIFIGSNVFMPLPTPLAPPAGFHGASVAAGLTTGKPAA